MKKAKTEDAQVDGGPCANDVPAPCGHAFSSHGRLTRGGGQRCAECDCEWYVAPATTEART